MRLLIFTTEFPNPYDPTKAVFNLHLAHALAARHEVKVISPVSWVDEVRGRVGSGNLFAGGRQLDVGGLEVHHPRYYYVPKALRRCSGRFLWRSARRTIRRVLGGFVPDAVFGYWAHPDGEVAVRTARLAGAASGVIVGGSDILIVGRTASRRGPTLSALRSADVVISVGHDLRRHVVEYGVDADKVHAWGGGVDVEQFRVGDRAEARRQLGLCADGPMLLWVGRMVPVKALHVLLQACRRLRDRGCAFRLYLVGDGELRAAHESLAEALGLSDVVVFLGARPHNQLPDWFRAADLTVLPSLSEGLPNVLRESMACGTPFVASRVGGIPEMATESYDRLVPPNDPAALADAIAAALSDPVRTPPAAARVASWAEQADELVRLLRPHLRPRATRPVPRPRPRRSPSLPPTVTS
jgi:glycosyltransferase involved in cell wall biosynthesis